MRFDEAIRSEMQIGLLIVRYAIRILRICPELKVLMSVELRRKSAGPPNLTGGVA